MDSRNDVSEFLRSRRAKVTPEQVNLVTGGNRRVPGLRREEVATLAAVSVDYYARLERGNLSGVSDEVLDAVAHALRLDEAETAHLFALARAAQPGPGRRRRPVKQPELRPSLQRLMDAITGAPTLLQNDRMDFIAANALGRALYAPVLADPVQPANAARFMFLNPDAQSFFPEWEQNASDIVATLRGSAGRRPHDRSLSDLVGELATRSEEFRIRWAAHNVRFHRTGLKRITHPVVGELALSYEALELPTNPGWTMYAYTAEPGSASEERLRLLASWAATSTAETGALQDK